MFTILVLEDDVELNETMTYGLEKEGYRVISVHSREEAEKAAENSPLALAILDVNLPDGDGFQFCPGPVRLGKGSGRRRFAWV